MHPSALPKEVLDRVVARRGRAHAFETLDAKRTALIVIDMQNTFCAKGAPIEVPVAREIVPNINRLARAARAAGVPVVWVQMTIPTMATWPVYLDSLVAPDLARDVVAGLTPGGQGHALWPEIEVDAADWFVAKKRFSAFLPGASDLAEQLQARGIDTVLIAGTLTNVCCESSARDAAMRDFRTIMVADANAARSDGEHLATLVTFAQSFGDVRTCAEVEALLSARAQRAAE